MPVQVGRELLPPGTPIDLSNCDREPIHIPGSVQPRGALLVLREPELHVLQASASAAALLGRLLDDLLDAPLADALGAGPAAEVARFASTFGDVRDRNPLELSLQVGGRSVGVDAILHRVRLDPDGPRAGSMLVVELEAAFGPRPFSFPNTYQAVRGAVAELNRATALQELYDLTAHSVKALTGFDRVMIYRYDADYNGEVVAEAREPELEPFLGLHYPASDIPRQARELYEKNWIRLIDDVGYVPSPISPTLNPLTGRPLDLTYSTLRSVSPIHVEYLRNMGVQASMSISLLRGDKLWGLIACHHYAGPHAPPYGVRAAAEFLGSTLSLRLGDRAEDEELHRALAARSTMAALTRATLDEDVSLTQALLAGPTLLDLVPADGLVVALEGEVTRVGKVPAPDVVERVVAWACDTGQDVVASEQLSAVAGLEVPEDVASGVLAVPLPEGQTVLWFRDEVTRSVDWGGNPHDKVTAQVEEEVIRLSPRKSFARWREVVRGRCEPWSAEQLQLAAQVRTTVVEALWARSRRAVRAAETLQRALLPGTLPDPAGWSIGARYSPSAGGRVGGDWYDAFELRDGRLALVLGDVAGHGLAAAGTMAQLRNALRAVLVESGDPAAALGRLDTLVEWLLPDALATAAVVVVDPRDGRGSAAAAGHPAPIVLAPDCAPAQLELAAGPPLGVGLGAPAAVALELPPGACLCLYSDGMVERRSESLDVGLARLQRNLASSDIDEVFLRTRDPESEDDATLLILKREPHLPG
ncbi:SpoIIE family protein phosphatase [Motilibacter sp. E257]|uniref:SpoIIE family protein phosphatase n=1 Tax=Motilibacter deserti TaxID=2714956 RepID=A0ABX0GVZ3_9ACTN|nr:SpoIIE family protein phosphatase [Motilibacter deserti]